MKGENHTSSIPGPIQQMFHEFVLTKGLNEVAAFVDMFEVYMLAMDEQLYLELKKKYLDTDNIKILIAARDNQDNNYIDEFIFLKMGLSETVDGGELGAEDTIEAYQEDELKKGYTWFSTPSALGEKRVTFFNEQIEMGRNVKMIFAIKNEIKFCADIMELISAGVPEQCPEQDGDPEVFRGQMAKTWIKLKNIRIEDKIETKMLKITSTGSDLKETISTSQYHLGYVSFKTRN